MIKELVLFGVTGDLARQKLIPALFNLYRTGRVSRRSSFIAFGRKNFSKTEFQNFIEEVLLKNKNTNNDAESASAIREFSSQWSYIASELNNAAGYKKLASTLITNTSVVYLSLPPAFQIEVSEMLISNAVLTKKTDRKLAIEKPYGFDMDSAVRLENILTRKLRADQILRVDHYAGKQALVELEQVAHLGIFEDMLRSSNFNKIQANFIESNDVSARGSFYDGVGALNDVVQNHVLHMLATILALPEFYKEKSSSVSKLRSEALDLLEIRKDKFRPVLAQYEGFKATQGVNPASTTETFFRVFGEIKKGSQNTSSQKSKDLLAKRWKGLKFELIGGKALSKPESSIILYPINKKQKTIHINLNGYGKDAYEQIFLDAFYYNKDRFMDFTQIKSGWEIVQKIKRLARSKIALTSRAVSNLKTTSNILTYKKGAYPQDISYKS